MVDFELTVGVEPGKSSVVIGYQVLLAPGLQSSLLRIPTFILGKVSSLTHFPLELRCEDYSFLDHAIADFEEGLDATLTDSIETLEFDTSLDEPDAITSSFSSGFLCSVSLFLILLNCNLLLASGLVN